MALFDRTISVEEFKKLIDIDEVIEAFETFGLVKNEEDDLTKYVSMSRDIKHNDYVISNNEELNLTTPLQKSVNLNSNNSHNLRLDDYLDNNYMDSVLDTLTSEAVISKPQLQAA